MVSRPLTQPNKVDLPETDRSVRHDGMRLIQRAVPLCQPGVSYERPVFGGMRRVIELALGAYR